MVDLYRARAIIEPAGALWGESLDVSNLLSVTHNSIESLNQGDLEALGENNQKFHRALVTAAGSQTLNQEMNNLLARMRLSWLQVLPSYPPCILRMWKKTPRLPNSWPRFSAMRQLSWCAPI